MGLSGLAPNSLSDPALPRLMGRTRGGVMLTIRSSMRRLRWSYIHPLFSRALLSSLRSVGFVISSGAQVASTRNRPGFFGGCWSPPSSSFPTSGAGGSSGGFCFSRTFRAMAFCSPAWHTPVLQPYGRAKTAVKLSRSLIYITLRSRQFRKER